MSTLVSVVVPTFGRPQLLLRALGALRASTLAPSAFEVIVVDDGSPDEVSRQLVGTDVRIHRQLNAGPAAARNAGWRLANSPLIAFTDDDCVPDPRWLEEIVSAFGGAASAAVGVGGAIHALRPGYLATFVSLERLVDHGLETDGSLRYLVTANAAFRREALVAAGGFDERFETPAGEDVDLSMRLRAAGGALVPAPAAVVLHDHRTALGPLLRTYRSHGRARAVLARRHRGGGIAVHPASAGPAHWVNRWRRYRTVVGWPTAVTYLFLHAAGTAAFALGALERRR